MQPPLKDLRARGSDVGPLEDMAATADECRLGKGVEDEPRDASGKWTSGGSSGEGPKVEVTHIGHGRGVKITNDRGLINAMSNRVMVDGKKAGYTRMVHGSYGSTSYAHDARGNELGSFKSHQEAVDHVVATHQAKLGKSSDPAATADEVRKEFDEGQHPRDESGKWTSGGGSSDPELTTVHIGGKGKTLEETGFKIPPPSERMKEVIRQQEERSKVRSQPESRASFSRGDRVEVNDPGTSYHGSSGSVASMGTGGMVRFVPHGELEDDAVDVHESKLVRKGSPDQPRAADGKWTTGGAEHAAASLQHERNVEGARMRAVAAARDHANRATELARHLESLDARGTHSAEFGNRVADHGADLERSLEDLKFATDQRDAHAGRAPTTVGRPVLAPGPAIEREWQRSKGERVASAAAVLGSPEAARRARAWYGKSMEAQVCKVDEGLGLVFGWAIICCEDGQPYFDKQDDHVPEDAMLEAACDFMLNSRDAGEMHRRTGAGSAIFAWPMTKEIADSFGIQARRTGLMFAMKPDAAMMRKFKSGELTAFSIGGQRGIDEKLDD